jgi:hypothetical protein
VGRRKRELGVALVLANSVLGFFDTDGFFEGVPRVARGGRDFTIAFGLTLVKNIYGLKHTCRESRFHLEFYYWTLIRFANFPGIRSKHAEKRGRRRRILRDYFDILWEFYI